ncbi:hypothetical protein INT47_011597 [Mucor saturninus]|uniref:Anaphase spindle elongation protein 1 n=1 Tax=Mucor saturninus TaxID=64648 RepID=A0A8H7V7J1_9FUNG|nr:hypothetical protein INT47_011597 [Mucor saturninus]
MTTIHDLTTEIHHQLERLSQLTDEIGYSEIEKKEKADAVLESVKGFVETQIEHVVKEKENIIKEAESTQKSILSFKKLMGEFASNKVVLDPSLSLQVNLTHLQQEKNGVEQRYNERLSHVKELYIQLEEYKTSMQDFVNINMEEQVDVSSLAVNALEEEIGRCEQEYTSRKDMVERGVKQISNLFAMLGIDPDTPQDLAIEQYSRESDPEKKSQLCHQFVSNENLQYIAIRAEQLLEMKQHIESRKEQITASIKHLWHRLNMEEDETCERFLMENRGLTRQELQNYEDEHNRLLVLKQDRVGDFIQTAREELKALWDQLYYSQSQREQFQPAFVNDDSLLSDAILEAHEDEISKLQLQVEDSAYILERIQKHMKLKSEVEEFEATTRDPNRLFSKGQRDPGRLLREEKFRKRISRELPKVTKELEGSLLEYEAMKGHAFLVHGKPYFDVIYEQDLASDSDKLVSHSRNLTISSQDNEKLPTTPRTPKRGIETRQPMTSPRAAKSVRRLFNTPQTHRSKSFHFSSTTTNELAVPTKIEVTGSILHQVRASNLKHHQQKVIRKGHIFDEEEEEEVENKAPPVPVKRNLNSSRKRVSVESQSESDDGLYLGIFDDGPELSDMSDLDDA